MRKLLVVYRLACIIMRSQCIKFALYTEDNGDPLGLIYYSLREQIIPSFPSRTSTTPELSTMEESKRSTSSAVYFFTALKLLKEVMHLLKKCARIFDHVVRNI